MTNPQAPSVTPSDIESAIASEHYFTAADGGPLQICSPPGDRQ